MSGNEGNRTPAVNCEIRPASGYRDGLCGVITLNCSVGNRDVLHDDADGDDGHTARRL